MAAAAANAQIGIERSAHCPSLGLTASFGNAASRVGDLFNASTTLWSLGVSVAQTLFDAGVTRARVEGAQAARDAAVARYRQTVLSAFLAVEDQLSLTRALAEQAGLRRAASEAADLTEQQLLNRYKVGQVGYTEGVTAQASALSARRTLARLAASRQAAAIGLIQAMGGGGDRSGTRPVIRIAPARAECGSCRLMTNCLPRVSGRAASSIPVTVRPHHAHHTVSLRPWSAAAICRTASCELPLVLRSKRAH